MRQQSGTITDQEGRGVGGGGVLSHLEKVARIIIQNKKKRGKKSLPCTFWFGIYATYVCVSCVVFYMA